MRFKMWEGLQPYLFDFDIFHAANQVSFAVSSSADPRIVSRPSGNCCDNARTRHGGQTTYETCPVRRATGTAPNAPGINP